MNDVLDFVFTQNFRTLSIPLYTLLIGLEFLLRHRPSQGVYRLNDTISNVSCGIISLGLNALYTGWLLDIYNTVRTNWAFWQISASSSVSTKIIVFFALIVLVDIIFYCGHRFSHMTNIGWAAHITHHSSENYNFSTALRQSGVEMALVFVFALPVAFIGVPASWYAAIASLNIVYQFWIHTQLIDKCPRWFEAIFNTPSHHRVHHARNSSYLDRNFAGMFIIWDRLLGTYAHEDRPPVFGITKPLASWNPIWAQFHQFIYLFECFKKLPWSQKFSMWWCAPGVIEKRWGDLGEQDLDRSLFDPPYSLADRNWGITCFLGGGLLGIVSTLLTTGWLQGIGCLLAASILMIGGFKFEGRLK